MESPLLEAADHRRSPATMPGYHQGRAPRNKGLRYPADPPTIEEIVAVMRAAGDGADGARLRALVVGLWRAGLRISEAMLEAAVGGHYAPVYLSAENVDPQQLLALVIPAWALGEQPGRRRPRNRA